MTARYLFPGLLNTKSQVSRKRMKLLAKEPPNIGVFWNFDSSRRIISSPDSIYHNVKSAFANQGHIGQVSVWAYCDDDDDDDLFLPDITMIPTGNRTARFKQMLKDILLWALLNPVDYPRTVPCLMVISDIAGNRQFVNVLQILVSDDYTVLLTVSDEMEYLRSVWFYPNLKKIQKSIITSYKNHATTTESLRASADAKREGPKTGIFWNFTDTHPRDIIDLDQIKSALANEGHRGEVSVKAYWEGKNRVRPCCFEHGSISLQKKRVSSDDATYMALDTTRKRKMCFNSRLG